MIELAILISLGGTLMAFAIYKNQQLTKSDYIINYRKTLNFLKDFMIIFFLGYIAILIFVLLGHSRISTTQIYAKVIERKVSDDMKKLREQFLNTKNDSDSLYQSL